MNASRPIPTPRRLGSRSRAAALLIAAGLAVTASAAPPGDLGPLRDLDSHSPFVPPASREAWERRAADLREQLLVSLGLWPMPNLPPLEPRIHGRIALAGYTVEKVVFESLPGLFVTGNLYRPDPLPANARVPAVLCPHGHWPNARFQDVAAPEVRQALASGAERFESAARNPLQARCVQLARMGCIVFTWDMLGYCDSRQIGLERAHHFATQDRATEVTAAGWLLYSPLADSHAQSVMGLQTLAVLRSIDFVTALPEVDADRVAITGASGGGTQSFVAAAIDPRIAVAFPAVMVSTGMQGGCTCENACGVRVGTGNVELAATIAPRPLGMTAANDWTKTMPEDGFPQLRRVYDFFGADGHVGLFPALQFGHNYNAVSRAAMYGWMNRHLGLGFDEPVSERDFRWLGRDELTVWDDEHPCPAGGEAFERKLLAEFRIAVDTHLLKLLATDPQTFRGVMGTGWKVVLGLSNGALAAAEAEAVAGEDDAWRLASPSDGTWAVRRSDAAAGQLAVVVAAANAGGSRRYGLALCGEAWDAAGRPESIDEQPLVANPRLSAAYTYCYNRPLFVRRARQLAATLAWLRGRFPDATLTVEGTGPHAALAAAGALGLTTIDPESADMIRVNLTPAGFRFANAASIRDPDFLPGSARFLDLPGLVGCLPLAVTVRGEDRAAFEAFARAPEDGGARSAMRPTAPRSGGRGTSWPGR